MNDMTQQANTDSGIATNSADLLSEWLGPVEALTRFSPNERIALEGADTSEHQETRYGVRIGGVGLVIGARAACEFILPVPVSRVPNTPSWLAGLMNLRGTLVPVFDLSLLIGQGPAVGESAAGTSAGRSRSLFLVFDRGPRAAALQIHGFPQALSGLEPLDHVPPPPPPLDECVSNAFAEAGVMWLEFDHERLFHALSQRLEIHAGSNLLSDGA